jgi:uncharacterized protein
MLASRSMKDQPDRAMSRRIVLTGGLAGLGALMVGCRSSNKSARIAEKSSTLPVLSARVPTGARSNLAKVGALGSPDANGVRLPPGFRSRLVARTGDEPVAGAGYRWHEAPDGGATFEAPDGGWIYVSNSERSVTGGAGALRFAPDGKIAGAYSILHGTTQNCAGGKTPWNSWLSCEEIPKGRVFECDPFGKKDAVFRPALGIFRHEAAAVDPETHHVYLTEDEPEGCLYRFTPDKKGELASGRLEVLQVDDDGTSRWHPVPDPGFERGKPTRGQVDAATHFSGAEGIAYWQKMIFFSTKGDDRVWAFDIRTQKLSLLYDRKTAKNPILSGVDNVTVTPGGDVLVAEDGGHMQVVALLSNGTPKALLQIVGHETSEVTGIAFDPSGTRLYLSSQRGVGGNGVGMTLEISGPFQA